VSFIAGFVAGVFATIFGMALWGLHRIRKQAAAPSSQEPEGRQ
jgi:hypothetical protein